VNRMKSSGTSYDTLFDAYENMRDRSEITAEIKTIEPMVQESMQAFDAYDDDWRLEDTIDHFYNKGYLEALQWVIAN
jgi:hypothetical protein